MSGIPAAFQWEPPFSTSQVPKTCLVAVVMHRNCLPHKTIHIALYFPLHFYRTCHNISVHILHHQSPCFSFSCILSFFHFQHNFHPWHLLVVLYIHHLISNQLRLTISMFHQNRHSHYPLYIQHSILPSHVSSFLVIVLLLHALSFQWLLYATLSKQSVCKVCELSSPPWL